MQLEFLNDEHLGKKAILKELESLRKVLKTLCLNNCCFPKLKSNVTAQSKGKTRWIKKGVWEE